MAENELDDSLFNKLENIEGMLDYETQIFLDILHNDGIIVAAKGICLQNVIANLFRAYCDPGNLVIAINCSDSEERYFLSKLGKEHVYSTTYNTSTDEREDLYLSGGIHFVTTRILVVDFLKKRLPIDKITGILVLNAHKILESCQEAFVMRLYRQQNKTGFVKAFSNDAQSFTYGFGQVERVMRSLFVKQLFIWPRFHSTIIKSLKRAEPQVIELHVPISSTRDRTQACILDLMNRTIKEIKFKNKTLEIQEMTVENSLTKKFHKILQNQLDVIWHQLSSSSRQLVAELKTLRHLLSTLFYSDSVTFYSILSQYRTKEYADKTFWVFYDEADQLFATAKSMMFNKSNELDPELSPKWQTLLNILNVEIPTDMKNNTLSTANVVILCQDRKTCYELNQFLNCGPKYYLFLNTLRSKIKFTTISESLKNGYHVNALQTLNCHEMSSEAKLKKVKKAKTITSSTTSKSEVGAQETETSDELEECPDLKSAYYLTMSESILQDLDASIHDNSQYVFTPLTQDETLKFTATVTNKPTILIRTFKESNDMVTLPETLHQLQPNYIIMYHCNVTTIRQIEVFEARRKEVIHPTKLFFLIHSGTVEEQVYLTSLRREKQAFEHLIETKRTMVVPEDQDGKNEVCTSLQFQTKDDSELTENTRQGGVAKADNTTKTVIVDMREFRSELPALIHKRGMTVEPLTITVGDYILTPDICVERKSVSDLIGSLNSGRLYQQCIQMSRYYATPMLLIEFDQSKTFSWECNYMVSRDGDSFEIQKKLLLLTMHFPKLKVIWSPSPYATAGLFEELKEGKAQPNSQYALAAKGDQDMEILQSKYNSGICDFLRKLPGVTSKNMFAILAAYNSMSDLCRATEEDLCKCVENSAEAKSLFAILHESNQDNNIQASKSTQSAPKTKFKYVKKK